MQPCQISNRVKAVVESPVRVAACFNVLTQSCAQRWERRSVCVKANRCTRLHSSTSTENLQPLDKNDKQCWACKACVHKASVICGRCRHVMPLDSTTNYFAALEMPQVFAIEPTVLDANFKRLQRSVHPDLYASKSQGEKEASAAASATLNVAYRILKDPASRAQYLLQLNGLDAIGEGAGSAAVSPALLMQVMEAREVIEDPASTTEDVRALKGRTDRAVLACVQDVAKAFAQGDLKQAASITVALQYYGRVSHEAAERLERQTLGQGQAKAAAAAVTPASTGHSHGADDGEACCNQPGACQKHQRMG